MRKGISIELEEIGGERFPDLETAWHLALPGLAKDLAASLQELLSSGVLIIQDGKIVINPAKEGNTSA